MTETRAPLPRSGDDMDLPPGKTCADCAHCRRCTIMFGHIPADESCDWSPSRFTPKRVQTVKALSIRQPWAWLIVNGHKDIENRDWHTRFRGPVLIHAAKGMTRAEYEDCCDYAARIGVTIPAFEALERGGIVGKAVVTGCVDDSESPWFFGRYGFVLAQPEILPFTPLKGSLGFFNVNWPTDQNNGAQP